MAYNPIHTRAAPIHEAYSDPIRERKRLAGEMVFQKYRDNVYTQPNKFPTYLSSYSPNYPPPPGPGQNFDNYPRSNLSGHPKGKEEVKGSDGFYYATYVPQTDCGKKYW